MLTVWERRRLNNATLVPEAIHTGEEREKSHVRGETIHLSFFLLSFQLTIGVLQGLLLLGGLGDDLDPLAEEEADVGAVAVQHLHRQHEVLPFVRVADVQRLSRAEVLKRKNKFGFFFFVCPPFTSLSSPSEMVQ